MAPARQPSRRYLETQSIEAPAVDNQPSSLAPRDSSGVESSPGSPLPYGHPNPREAFPASPAHNPVLVDIESKALIQELREELRYYKRKAHTLDKQVFQMRTLLQSGKGFSDLMSVETLLEAFMSVCRERYEATTSAVLLVDDLDPSNVYYRVRAFHGLASSFQDRSSLMSEETLLFRIPRDKGLLWQMIQQGEVFSVVDMAGAPRFPAAFSTWDLQVLRSAVWIPLLRGTQVLGLLTLGPCAHGRQIEESDYSFLQEIAAVAATNIDSTLKYEKNARTLSSLRTLYDVNQQLADVNDFKQLTVETLATAVGALKAQKANLMLLNPETQRLEIKVVWGNIPKGTREAINSGQMETRTFALGEGIAGQVAQTGRPIRVSDQSKIPQIGKNVAYCILAVPLMQGRDCVGVITLTNKLRTAKHGAELDPVGRFGEEDEHLLLALADQASVNLQKARLYSASVTDRLTGLGNMRHFESSLEEAVELATQNTAQLSLAVLDIDHFKRVNDNYGHRVGDFVLSKVARMLSDYIEEEGTCFRYGGEEFCVVLPGKSLQEAGQVLEGFRSHLAQAELENDHIRHRVTVSGGVAALSPGAHTHIALFQSADEALYAAKSSGRNTICLASDNEHIRVRAGQSSPSSSRHEGYVGVSPSDFPELVL